MVETLYFPRVICGVRISRDVARMNFFLSPPSKRNRERSHLLLVLPAASVWTATPIVKARTSSKGYRVQRSHMYPACSALHVRCCLRRLLEGLVK